MLDNKIHYRTCNLCEAMCGLEITYKEKKVISIVGDKKDPLSKGFICPKSLALKDLYEDPDRLKTPIKRTENGWQEISWTEAFDEVEIQIKKIQEKYGNNAVATYQGNPNVHNVGSMLYGGPFLKSLKTKQKYSATSADQLPHHIASLKMFGHQMLIPIPDIERTDYLLILGANPGASNGSLLTAPGFPQKIKSIQKRGGKVINIDPRFTETSKISSQHLYINPGKDALFLLSLLHVIFDQGIEEKTHLSNYLKGLEEIKEIVKEYSPKKTALLIGIDSLEIQKIAKDFMNSKTAVCYGRMGVSTQEYGGICQWLINVLNIVTNNMDKVGGAMFTKPAIDLVYMTGIQGKVGNFDRYRSRVHNLPEYSGELPVATLADEILTEGEGQIKMFICTAGNPVLSAPNGKKMEKALEKLDFMVSIDIYLNETSKYANIILPTTNGLETLHYDLVFHQLAIRNTAKLSEVLFEKDENQKHDWQILNELTERITEKKNSLTPEMMLDNMFQYSPYKEANLSVNKLKENPNGIDLGSLQPLLIKRIFTVDKKINVSPQIFIDDLKRLDKELYKDTKEEETKYPFALIGRRHLRNNNSWMHNSKLLMKGKNRCTVLMSSKDANNLSITDHQKIKIISNVGSIELPVEISDEMKEGVLSIPHGFGHNRNGTKIKLAEENAGESINDLTDDNKIDKLTGNANFSGTRVKVIT
ncbi:molybdopterin-dependent oxidoreductase [Flavobacteriaceae bacterium]|jgi:anaerobic selenocysteine-containing dehydrogenase|nr:molybdopterin-dependent oxidoreductase [Flavobacteriaceae bacterium]MDB4064596.1 molybdopterin-dependent oxidoreductase [Flavobacteriaceae bacterium]MDB4207005.1 molybdopterin-dependent oxidoreductase [Flavobacteriaceae bacterium]MDB9893233.1 molybdopterin-dependent oxidoreductase [Flavobacteriaceae bacterium]MDC1343506.1 molybdopterin-dependent oxidoreductase [Flavobacteriaceae bacterium]|tara:strand:- start:4213 stop:6318 length:2106 start_codon:yes stop_codon:yes gene_type:complete